MRSWTRARLMSGIAWARYWSRRRLAAAGSAMKVWMWSSASSSKSTSRTGTGGGTTSSTPRVARYSCFTVRRRWPLGSMFLDGMGDQLSGLEEKDGASEGDHDEGDPLDGIEEGSGGFEVWGGLAEEREEELGGAGGGEGEGEGVAGVVAVAELAEEDEGQRGCGEGGVDG